MSAFFAPLVPSFLSICSVLPLWPFLMAEARCGLVVHGKRLSAPGMGTDSPRSECANFASRNFTKITNATVFQHEHAPPQREIPHIAGAVYKGEVTACRSHSIEFLLVAEKRLRRAIGFSYHACMKQGRKSQELYEAMADAIELMKSDPDLAAKDIAKAVGMSVSRFEHAFVDWAGTTPKRYRNYLKNKEAKERLRSSGDILKSTYASDLKSPARLGELLVTYEAVTPSEVKSGDIDILYGIHPSPFGHCLIAATKRGVCHVAFMDTRSDEDALQVIKEKWPEALVRKDQKGTKVLADKIFAHRRGAKPVHLLIKGTNFQIKVWEALLAIPQGQTSTYAAIAKAIGKSKAVRAVGTACGKNAIGLLIPCHRVLASSGSLGGYRWGLARKRALLAREAL